MMEEAPQNKQDKPREPSRRQFLKMVGAGIAGATAFKGLDKLSEKILTPEPKEEVLTDEEALPILEDIKVRFNNLEEHKVEWDKAYQEMQADKERHLIESGKEELAKAVSLLESIKQLFTNCEIEVKEALVAANQRNAILFRQSSGKFFSDYESLITLTQVAGENPICLEYGFRSIGVRHA